VIATALDVNNVDSVNTAMQPVQPILQPVNPPRELSPFEQRAIPMIERGVPVIPLRPRTKIAFLQNWEGLASTDSKVVTGWGKEYPDANSACVAKAKLGGVWFFEVDNPEVLGMIEKTAKIPKTLRLLVRRAKRIFTSSKMPPQSRWGTRKLRSTEKKLGALA
jgi:hypothetical protein